MYDLFNTRQKPAVHQQGSGNIKCKVTRKGTSLWYTIRNQKLQTKITASIIQAMYYLILQHPQVVKSKIANDSVKVFIDGQNVKHSSVCQRTPQQDGNSNRGCNY